MRPAFGLRIALSVCRAPGLPKMTGPYDNHMNGLLTVPIQRDIYPNLKLRIYTSGLRQNRIAKMLGIDEAHMSKIVNGFREPNDDLRKRLAEILMADPDWLFHKVMITEENPLIDARPMPPIK